MVEIMENGNKNKVEYEWRELPKNVRQIGENKEARKIYIEDYVVTYLRRLAKPNQAYARGAILFGNIYETEEGTAIFISGAVEAQNLELDMDETIFNDQIWEEITKKGQQYFVQQEIVGWFLSRMGFSVEMNQKIMNTHLKNFPGDYKILYMMDSLDKEDAMYLYENQRMHRQKGYYIYYEKNNAMQEYMIRADGKGTRSSEEESKKTELRRDRKVVNGYRKMNHYHKQNRNQNMKIRLARAACLVLIFVLGVNIIGQLKERMSGFGPGKTVIETFSSLVGTNNTHKGQVQEETRTGEGQPVTREEKEEKEGTGDGGDVEGKNETESRSETEDKDEKGQLGTDTTQNEQTQPVITIQKPLYYTVEKGDTLLSISRKMYSTERYAGNIAKANNLTNADQIYEGQEILIPSVE